MEVDQWLYKGLRLLVQFHSNIGSVNVHTDLDIKIQDLINHGSLSVSCFFCCHSGVFHGETTYWKFNFLMEFFCSSLLILNCVLPYRLLALRQRATTNCAKVNLSTSPKLSTLHLENVSRNMHLLQHWRMVGIHICTDIFVIINI